MPYRNVQSHAFISSIDECTQMERMKSEKVKSDSNVEISSKKIKPSTLKRRLNPASNNEKSFTKSSNSTNTNQNVNLNVDLNSGLNDRSTNDTEGNENNISMGNHLDANISLLKDAAYNQESQMMHNDGFTYSQSVEGDFVSGTIEGPSERSSIDTDSSVVDRKFDINDSFGSITFSAPSNMSCQQLDLPTLESKQQNAASNVDSESVSTSTNLNKLVIENPNLEQEGKNVEIQSNGEDLEHASLLFPDLNVAPPMPLRLSPLSYLPQLLRQYSTIIQGFQTDEKAKQYQRSQYASLITDSVLDLLQSCLERKFEYIKKGEEDTLIIEKKRNTHGWQKLHEKELKMPKDKNKSMSSRSDIESVNTSAMDSYVDVSPSSRHSTSARDEFEVEHVSLGLENERLRKRLQDLREASNTLYNHFQQRDMKHLSRVIYGSKSNYEYFRNSIEERMHTILERFEFSLIENFRKERLDGSEHISFEYQTMLNSLGNELQAQRNIADAMKERIQEITSESIRNTQTIMKLKKRLENKDQIINDLRKQYLEDIDLLKDQLFRKEENYQPDDYNPRDFNLFFTSQVDLATIAQLRQENQILTESLTKLSNDFQKEREALIREKYLALDEQKKQIYQRTKMSAFDDTLKPISSSISQVEPKHVKVITTQNMELVREKYDAMRSMLEQMKAELYLQFEEKNVLQSKLDELRSISRENSEKNKLTSDDHIIQLHKLEMEKLELEEKLKEMMYNHHQSSIDQRKSITALQNRLQVEERRTREMTDKIDTLNEERRNIIRNHVKALENNETTKRFRIIDIKSPTSQVSHTETIETDILRYSKEIQTDHVKNLSSNNDALTEMNTDSNISHTSQDIQSSKTFHRRQLEVEQQKHTTNVTAELPTPISEANRLKLSWRVGKKKIGSGQQTSPRLLNAYIKNHSKQFMHLFPKPKPKVITTVSHRSPKKRTNFIEKNAQSVSDVIDMDNTRKIVEALIRNSEESFRTTIENEKMLQTLQANPKSSKQINEKPTQKILAKRPKTTGAPYKRSIHRTLFEIESESKKPISRTKLADYLNIHSSDQESLNFHGSDEEAGDEEVIEKQESELKPGVSIVELIDNTEEKPVKISDMIRLTTEQLHLEKDLNSIEKTIQNEKKFIESHYETKINHLKSKLKRLGKNLELVEMTPVRIKAIQDESIAELKEKYDAKISELTQLIENQRQKISSMQRSMNGINILSFTPLTDAIFSVISLENERDAVKHLKSSAHDSIGRPKTSISLHRKKRSTHPKSPSRQGKKFSTTNSSANDTMALYDFTYSPPKDAPMGILPNEFTHDDGILDSTPSMMEGTETNGSLSHSNNMDRITSTWNRIIAMIRSLATSKSLSNLTTVHLDLPANLPTSERSKTFEPRLHLRTVPKLPPRKRSPDNMTIVSLPLSLETLHSNSNTFSEKGIEHDKSKDDLEEEENIYELNNPLHDEEIKPMKTSASLKATESNMSNEASNQVLRVSTEQLSPIFPQPPPWKNALPGSKVKDTKKGSFQLTSSIELPLSIVEALRASQMQEGSLPNQLRTSKSSISHSNEFIEQHESAHHPPKTLKSSQTNHSTQHLVQPRPSTSFAHTSQKMKDVIQSAFTGTSFSHLHSSLPTTWKGKTATTSSQDYILGPSSLKPSLKPKLKSMQKKRQQKARNQFHQKQSQPQNQNQSKEIIEDLKPRIVSLSQLGTEKDVTSIVIPTVYPTPNNIRDEVHSNQSPTTSTNESSHSTQQIPALNLHSIVNPQASQTIPSLPTVSISSNHSISIESGDSSINSFIKSPSNSARNQATHQTNTNVNNGNNTSSQLSYSSQNLNPGQNANIIQDSKLNPFPSNANPKMISNFNPTQASIPSPPTDDSQNPIYTLQHADLIHLAKSQQKATIINKSNLEQQMDSRFGVFKPTNKYSK